MALGDLVTLEDATAWLGDEVVGSPDLVSRLISSVSSEISQFVSYPILAHSVTKRFSGTGSDRLMLPDIPVTNVASVVVSGVSIPLAGTMTAAGYDFDHTTVYLRGYSFARGSRNIEISWEAGYTDVPMGIQQACLDWIKVCLQRQIVPANVSQMEAGETRLKLGDDAIMAKNRLIAPMPASIYAALQPYSRVYPA